MRPARSALVDLIAVVLVATVLAACSSGRSDKGSSGSSSTTTVSEATQGVTGSSIAIGINYIDAATQNQGNEQFGNRADHDVSDPKAQAQAILDYVNAHGGIAGRSVKPVFYDSKDLSNFDAQDQAACSAFTQDQKVFAVASVGIGGSVLRSCLAKANTPLVRDFYGGLVGQSDVDAVDGFFYQPDAMTAERLAGAWVDDLDEAGYFDKGSKVAVVLPDHPADDAVLGGVLTQRLEAHGLKVTDTQKLVVDKVEDYAKAGADLASAVLRFKSEGVDHVMFFDTAGFAPFAFGSAADGQGFHPRYALTTLEFPSAIASEVPPTQLKGAIATGWAPTFDVATPQDPAPTPSRTACQAIFDAAGIKLIGRQDVSQALRWCDQLLFLQAALKGVSSPSPKTLLSGVEHLGRGFQAAGTFSTAFSSGQRDGVAAVQAATFDEGCTCFSYTGSQQKVR